MATVTINTAGKADVVVVVVAVVVVVVVGEGEFVVDVKEAMMV